MDSALEVRTPFLTEAVHAAAWSLRDGQRKPPFGGAGKPMLRQILKGRLPGIRFERRKQGFAAPLGDQKLPQLWLCVTFAAWRSHHPSMS